MTTEQDEKVRENRLRRMARRQGYALSKSRTRDPRATDYGGWMIIDPYSNTAVAGGRNNGWSMSLDDVQAWLMQS